MGASVTSHMKALPWYVVDGQLKFTYGGFPGLIIFKEPIPWTEFNSWAEKFYGGNAAIITAPAFGHAGFEGVGFCLVVHLDTVQSPLEHQRFLQQFHGRMERYHKKVWERQVS